MDGATGDCYRVGMMPAPESIPLPNYHAARKAIEANMAKAIRSGCGAIVDVTIAAFGRYTVSGMPAHVDHAATVMRAAGLVLVERVYDEELGEAFAYWSPVPRD